VERQSAGAAIPPDDRALDKCAGNPAPDNALEKDEPMAYIELQPLSSINQVFDRLEHGEVVWSSTSRKRSTRSSMTR
jgi:hypothetical protein